MITFIIINNPSPPAVTDMRSQQLANDNDPAIQMIIYWQNQVLLYYSFTR